MPVNPADTRLYPRSVWDQLFAFGMYQASGASWVADAKQQTAFIALYERLMTELAADEVIYFADAAHPEHQARPADGWVRRGSNPALRRTSGRGRVNIHGAVNLENFDRPFAEPITADGKSSVQLLAGIEARNPGKRRVHVT